MNDIGHFRRWFLIIFALFCVGLNVVAFILYEKNQKLSDTKQWVAHTYEVMNKAYRLYTDVQDMMSAQRGYLLTGNQNFLGPYKRSNLDIEETYKDIQELTADNEERKAELVVYYQSIVELKKTLDVHMATWDSTHEASKIDFDESKALMDKIRSQHAVIIDSESQLLAARQAREKREQQNYVATLFATAGLSAIGLLLANGLVGFLAYRRKFAEDDLRRINKEMEGFTYIASHDLRSPLVNLKGFASEMKYSVDELRPIVEKAAAEMSDSERSKALEIIESDIPDALHYIHSSVEKMDKLTNAILELSRIGRRTIDFKNVETTRVVQHILDTLHHTINSKNIKINLQPLPDVFADQLGIEQVFSNIIDNAIKYMQPGKSGFVEIGGVRTRRETKFWVKDNGRGIKTDDFQKIFEIYRRAGDTQNIPGEGMGMAYVRATLRRLGGQIWCESVPGFGTTFYFTISNYLKKDESE